MTYNFWCHKMRACVEKWTCWDIPCLLVWVIDSTCLFFIISVTFLGCNLTMFLDGVEVWFYGPTVFRCSWLLRMPAIIIIGIIIEFSLVFVHSSSEVHLVYLVSFIRVFVKVMELMDSKEALNINFMVTMYYIHLIQVFFKVKMWYGFTAVSRSYIHQ